MMMRIAEPSDSSVAHCASGRSGTSLWTKCWANGLIPEFLSFVPPCLRRGLCPRDTSPAGRRSWARRITRMARSSPSRTRPRRAVLPFGRVFPPPRGRVTPLPRPPLRLSWFIGLGPATFTPVWFLLNRRRSPFFRHLCQWLRARSLFRPGPPDRGRRSCLHLSHLARRCLVSPHPGLLRQAHWCFSHLLTAPEARSQLEGRQGRPKSQASSVPVPVRVSSSRTLPFTVPARRCTGLRRPSQWLLNTGPFGGVRRRTRERAPSNR